MEMFNVTLPVHNVSNENTLEQKSTKSIKRIYLFIVKLKLGEETRKSKNKLNSSSFTSSLSYAHIHLYVFIIICVCT